MEYYEKIKLMFIFSYIGKDTSIELELILHNKSAYLFVYNKEDFISKVSGNGFIPEEIFDKPFKASFTLKRVNFPSQPVLFIEQQQNASTAIVYEMFLIKESIFA